MTNPTSVTVPEATITPTLSSAYVFEPLSNHPDLVINSIGVTISGSDLSRLLSASLVYFTAEDNASEMIFPLSGVFRSCPAKDVLTITHALRCFSAANTVVSCEFDWGSGGVGLSALVNIVFTYVDAEQGDSRGLKR